MEFDHKAFVSSLTDDELCAEVLSWEFSKNMSDDELVRAVRERHVSSFFANNLSLEQIELLKREIARTSNLRALLPRT